MEAPLPQVFKGDRVIGHCSLSLCLFIDNQQIDCAEASSEGQTMFHFGLALRVIVPKLHFGLEH